MLSPSVSLHLPHLLYSISPWLILTRPCPIGLLRSFMYLFFLIFWHVHCYLLFIYHSLLLASSPLLPSPILSPILQLQDIVYICLLITSRASLDLTDVAIIRGISRLNTLGLFGEFSRWFGSEARQLLWIWPFFLFHSVLRSDSPATLWFVIFYILLACWCRFIQIGAQAPLSAAASVLGLKCNCYTYDEESWLGNKLSSFFHAVQNDLFTPFTSPKKSELPWAALLVLSVCPRSPLTLQH